MTGRTDVALYALLVVLSVAVLLLLVDTASGQGVPPDTLTAPPSAQLGVQGRLALWQDAALDDGLCGGNPRCVYSDGTDAVRVVRRDGVVYIALASGGDTFYSAKAPGVAVWETMRGQPPGSLGWILVGFYTPAQVFDDVWASYDDPL